MALLFSALILAIVMLSLSSRLALTSDSFALLFLGSLTLLVLLGTGSERPPSQRTSDKSLKKVE